MKKIIIIALFVVVLVLIYISKSTTEKVNKLTITSDRAITLVQEKNPNLKDYPSDNLPPKRIEIKRIENGWLIGFYIEGSGLPGILNAQCYRVLDSEVVTKTGEFTSGGKGGPATLNLSTCMAE